MQVLESSGLPLNDLAKAFSWGRTKTRFFLSGEIDGDCLLRRVVGKLVEVAIFSIQMLYITYDIYKYIYMYFLFHIYISSIKCSSNDDICFVFF